MVWLISYLKKFDKVYLASFRKIHDHLEYLYSENKKVELLLIYDNAIELYRNKKLPVLRIGLKKQVKILIFLFIEQLNLDQTSYDNFHLPIDEKQQELLNHCIKSI